MKIHRLLSDELPRIRRLAQMFADEVKLFGGYSPEALEGVWRPLMEVDLADIFYAADDFGELTGFLGCSWVPDLYSGVPAAQSQFWFVAPEYRKGSLAVRLFQAFEQEAKSRGAKRYFVGYKEGVHEVAMKAFFLRHGYVLGEYIYWRNV